MFVCEGATRTCLFLFAFLCVFDSLPAICCLVFLLFFLFGSPPIFFFARVGEVCIAYLFKTSGFLFFLDIIY